MQVEKKNWLLIVDDATDYTHSFCLKRKSDLVETLTIWIKNLFMKYNIRIQKIRLDKSGENRMLQIKANQQNLGIKFEFTAPGTPQQKNLVERKLATQMGRARAMMTHTGFDDHVKRKFCCEAVSTGTKLDNILVRHMGGKPPYYMFYKEHPKYKQHLGICGDIAVVANHERKSTRTKIEHKEKIEMFVGYAEDHAGDVCRFFHIKT